MDLSPAELCEDAGPRPTQLIVIHVLFYVLWQYRFPWTHIVRGWCGEWQGDNVAAGTVRADRGQRNVQTGACEKLLVSVGAWGREFCPTEREIEREGWREGREPW